MKRDFAEGKKIRGLRKLRHRSKRPSSYEFEAKKAKKRMFDLIYKDFYFIKNSKSVCATRCKSMWIQYWQQKHNKNMKEVWYLQYIRWMVVVTRVLCFSRKASCQ